MPSIALTLPTTLQMITASLHANNYSAIQAAVNGLDNNNVASAAGIVLSKLGQSGAAVNQVPVWSGSSWAVGDATNVVSRSGATIDVVNTVAETDILGAAGVSIPANTMGTGRAVRVSMIGDYLNNTGGSVTETLRIYFGGTKLYDSTASGVATSATRRGWKLDFTLANLGSSASQFLAGVLHLGTANAASPGVGFITSNALGNDVIAMAGTSTLDTTAAQTLRVTVQHGTASASASWRQRWYGVEAV